MHLDNVPGFVEGVSGQELASRFRAQAERFGVEMLQAQDVVELYRQDNYHGVETGDGSRYSARAVLIASSRSREWGSFLPTSAAWAAIL